MKEENAPTTQFYHSTDSENRPSSSGLVENTVEGKRRCIETGVSQTYGTGRDQ